MPNIHQELIIGAPAEKVFAAITTQQGLAGWWTPGAQGATERNSIVRFRFGDYFKEMRVVDVESPKQVQWACVAGADSAADEWIGTTLSFTLHDGDKAALSSSRPEARDQIQQQTDSGTWTLLVFNHDAWKDYTPMFAECSYTWGQFLRSLKLLCETGKGRPWPHQHRSEP